MSNKFKITLSIIAVFIISLPSYSFDDESCLKSEYKTTIKKAFAPMGLLEETLAITKSKCEITIEHVKAKYLGDKWKIDICREPIHIKSGKNLQNVVKRKKSNCHLQKESPFCQEYSVLKNILEDKGLIYGDGQREDISSEHGRVYCSYLLINQHLENGVVFSFEKPLSIVLNGQTTLNSLEGFKRNQIVEKRHFEKEINTEARSDKVNNSDEAEVMPDSVDYKTSSAADGGTLYDF